MAHAAHAPRRSARTRQAHYAVDATITPETGFKVSLMQLCVLLGVAFAISSGYVYLVWDKSTIRSDITDIKAAQTTAIATTTAAIKDQDDKRAQLGKQFIESNEKIASAVTTLASQMAVQQERQKNSDEKLEKVLTLIDARLAQQPPAPRR